MKTPTGKLLLIAILLAVASLAALAGIFSDHASTEGLLVTAAATCVACALFAWSVALYRKVIWRSEAKKSFLQLLVWLGLLMVVLPNFTMIMLLYGGGLARLLSPLALLMFFTGSLYYQAPDAIFGEHLFLQETVLSPIGMAGVMVSVVFWLTLVVLVATALHLVSLSRNTLA